MKDKPVQGEPEYQAGAIQDIINQCAKLPGVQGVVMEEGKKPDSYVCAAGSDTQTWKVAFGHHSLEGAKKAAVKAVQAHGVADTYNLFFFWIPKPHPYDGPPILDYFVKAETFTLGNNKEVSDGCV